MPLDRTIHCDQCGYDLAGLKPTGNCPECGNRFNVSEGEGVTDRSPPDDLREKLAPHTPALVCLGLAFTLLAASVAVGLLRQTIAPPILASLPAFFLVWIAYRMWRGS